jgi:peptidoglycan/xylan/chitin deacetylase (PgdA/CDA1 family)
MEILSHASRVRGLADLCRATKANTAPCVAITFDDGYQDNLDVAAPVLGEFGFPATVFVPSNAIGRGRDYWWDELETIVFRSPELPDVLDLTLGGAPVSWRGSNPDGADDFDGSHKRWRVWNGDARTPLQQLYTSLWKRLITMAPDDRRSTIETLCDWAGAGAGAATHPTMDRSGLARLTAGGGIAIGGHTRNHSFLTQLDAAGQREEILGGKRDLESATGTTLTELSYPYGAYDAETLGIVRDAGFEVACTTRTGGVRSSTPDLEVPRVAVSDWTADEFEATLNRYLAGARRAAE